MLQRTVHNPRIVWEPRLPRTLFRRASWEQATVVDVAPNGARVLARANKSITCGTRISIGLGGDHGLVEVREVEAAADKSHSLYGVQFLWLDDNLQTLFDDARSKAPTLLDDRTTV